MADSDPRRSDTGDVPVAAVVIVGAVEASLAHVDVHSVDDDDLRELVVQTERATRMLQALQATVMTEMVDRSRLDVTPALRASHGDGHPEEFVVDEVAVLLSCTNAAASVKLATAWQAHRFASTAVAWREGRIDGAKVRTISDGIAPLTAQDVDLPQLVDDTLIEQLVDAAVEYASAHTTGQLRPWLSRRVISIDAAAAERRRQRAMSDRRVVITPGPDGMSELWAVLPSVKARQIQQTLTAIAHDAPAHDPRSADQRRADGFCDLLLGDALAPQVGLNLVLTATAGNSAVQVDPVAELAGVGTITAAQAHELLASAADSASKPTGTVRGQVLPCDPSTGRLALPVVVESGYRPSIGLDRQVRARDLTCRFPGCRRAAVGSASGVDVDHTVAWPAGQTSADNLACLCRRHHRLKHSARWCVEHTGDGVLEWTGPTGRRYPTVPWQYADPPPP